MNANSRACVACIAAAIASGSTPRSVYDYSQQKHISISGSATTSSVNIYDYDRGCYISGNSNSFYDYGTGSYVSLKVNGNQFQGYDYDEGHSYEGEISNKSVSIYDYGESTYFQYKV